MLRIDTQRDRIIAHLTNQHNGDGKKKSYLTSFDQERLDDLLQLGALIRLHKVRRKVINAYMNTTGRSESQAYLDYNEAQLILGRFEKISKDFLRSLVIDAGLEVYAKAIAKDDLKSANGALTNIRGAGGLDKEDVNAPDYSRFQPQPQRFGWFPEQVKKDLPEDHILIPLLKKLAGAKKDFKLQFDFQALANDTETSE